MPVDPSFSSNALAVASDASFDAQGDAYDGSLVKVEPSAGEIAQGALRPGKQIGAQHFNWLVYEFAKIFVALISNDAAHETRLDTDEALLDSHETRLDVAEAWITNSSPRIKIIEFLVSGSFIVPPRCIAGLSWACGGGGAGGGGKQGDLTVNHWAAGGGGGGGAIASLLPLRSLVSGETIHVDVGAGGEPYTLTLGGSGNNGGDTIIRRGATPLAVHAGAQGGRGAVGVHAVADWNWFTMGGTSTKDTPIMLIGVSGQGIRVNVQAATLFGVGANGMSLYFPMQPAQGGFGAGGSQNPSASPGSKNPAGGFAGGLGGVKGTDGTISAGVATGANSTRRGCGGGCGGGAGPFGVGGDGGAGQHGDPDGGSVAATSPFNAGAYTGAGGGGGGSGGYCDDIVDVGGNNNNFGAAGGSGRAYIILVQESGT
ncbi:MAG: hypothetical protein JWM74_2625 [Myxococcaceae bacterium]|nr:hypothetical protein [Myxococcaceae bacterium]